MNRMLFVALLSTFACAGPSLERVSVPPASPPERAAPENAPPTSDEPVTAQWLEREIARKRGEAAPQQPSAPGPVGTTNEEATRAWFDRTIEERRTANPSTPPEPIQQIVERTVYVDRGGVGYDQYGQPVYGAPASRSTFPVNTALGAGIGAAIGSGSGDCGEGAAIGAGVGLLIDLLSYPW